MAVDVEPSGIIKGPGCNCSHAWPQLGCVRDCGSAFRTKAHSQPAAAHIRVVLDLRQLALQEFDGLLFERSQNRKGARQPPLAKLAVTNGADNRLSLDSIANSATCTSSIVSVGHRSSLDQLRIGRWTVPKLDVDRQQPLAESWRNADEATSSCVSVSR